MKLSFLKNEQGVYWSKDYLSNLELSTAHIDPKFNVAPHFTSSFDGGADTGNQTMHHYIQDAFLKIA